MKFACQVLRLSLICLLGLVCARFRNLKALLILKRQQMHTQWRILDCKPCMESCQLAYVKALVKCPASNLTDPCPCRAILKTIDCMELCPACQYPHLSPLGTAKRLCRIACHDSGIRQCNSTTTVEPRLA